MKRNNVRLVDSSGVMRGSQMSERRFLMLILSDLRHGFFIAATMCEGST